MGTVQEKINGGMGLGPSLDTCIKDGLGCKLEQSIYMVHQTTKRGRSELDIR